MPLSYRSKRESSPIERSRRQKGSVLGRSRISWHVCLNRQARRWGLCVYTGRKWWGAKRVSVVSPSLRSARPIDPPRLSSTVIYIPQSARNATCCCHACTYTYVYAHTCSVRLPARKRRPSSLANAHRRGRCGMQLLFNVYARLLANQVAPLESLICEQVCERIVAYPRGRWTVPTPINWFVKLKNARRTRGLKARKIGVPWAARIAPWVVWKLGNEKFRYSTHCSLFGVFHGKIASADKIVSKKNVWNIDIL